MFDKMSLSSFLILITKNSKWIQHPISNRLNDSMDFYMKLTTGSKY
jgi:hypothetical protein